MRAYFNTVRTVQYSECDMYGIMHNIDYLKWLEDAMANCCYEHGVTFEGLTLDFKSRFIRALNWQDVVKIDLEMEIKEGIFHYKGRFQNVETNKNAFLFLGKKG